MRRTAVLFATLIAGAATGTVGTGAGVADRASARLRLLDTEPVTLRATGFKPNEHVRIAILADIRVVRRAAAGTGGTFTMRLPGLDLNACTGFLITATGDRGTRATYKRAPGMCPQP